MNTSIQEDYSNSVDYAALTFGILVGVKVYRMYENAISLMTLEDRVESIRGREDFTDYSELTDFYIKAVISAEDHRFMRHSGFDPIAIGRAAPGVRQEGRQDTKEQRVQKQKSGSYLTVMRMRKNPEKEKNGDL